MNRLNRLWLCLLALLLCAGCAGGGGPAATGADNAREGTDMNPIATITLESKEVIRIELLPDVAPNTVANFISLANDGFYDGTLFHRVISGFMIQSGDPEGTGFGGPGYRIKGEFALNGWENNLSHQPGVLSMARTSNGYDTGGSQYFICVGDASGLDGQYAAFGRVADESSLEICLRIASVPTTGSPKDRPLEKQGIKTIRVDTHGVAWPAPETLPEG